MSHRMEEHLQRTIRSRRDRGSLRSSGSVQGVPVDGCELDVPVDFSSNDYLGFSRSLALHERINTAIASHENGIVRWQGSSGSRLLSGTHQPILDLEAKLAGVHKAEAGIIFNSGYDANIGMFSSILSGKQDLFVYDELIHASCHDGMRLSRGGRRAFKHNSVADLRKVLCEERASRGSDALICVAVETLYSMDGDTPPLLEIVDTADEFEAAVIVDEAHATGVMGPNYLGLVDALGLEDRIFARLHTFSKSIGCHGSIVLGSQALSIYLANYAKSFVYTTALPPHSALAVSCAYDYLADAGEHLNAHVSSLISHYRSILEKYNVPSTAILDSKTPIQGIITGCNESAIRLASELQSAGFEVKPIRSPTVPRGTERIRVILHSHNTHDEVERLCAKIANCMGLHSVPKDVPSAQDMRKEHLASA
eukprot:Clim_evm14s203 gene=Clim_evmTU14s203